MDLAHNSGGGEPGVYSHKHTDSEGGVGTPPVWILVAAVIGGVLILVLTVVIVVIIVRLRRIGKYERQATELSRIHHKAAELSRIHDKQSPHCDGTDV